MTHAEKIINTHAEKIEWAVQNCEEKIAREKEFPAVDYPILFWKYAATID